MALAVGCVSEPESELGSRRADRLTAPLRVRVVAANLTTGRRQRYESPGRRILSGLDADVVLIQEMNVDGNRTEDIADFVDETFGPGFEWYREPRRSLPNGVVSRYPIREAGVWEDRELPNREFVWARIDPPGAVDLWVVSVHLKSGSNSTQTREAREIVRRVRQQVPSDAYLVVGGDFNTTSRRSGAVRILSDIVDTRGPYPVDDRGDGDTNRNRNRPYDWVLANRRLDDLETSVQLRSEAFPNGLVVDTRIHSPLSDLSPARREDSRASSMQHMAVVRDFVFPPDPAAPDAGIPDLSRPDADRPDLGSADMDAHDLSPPDVGDLDLGAPDLRPRDLGPSDAGSSDVGVTKPAVFFNEILANEPGSDPRGEFIELVATRDVDLSGMTIADGSGVRHRFPSRTFLRSGRALVLSASQASTGALGLSNGGDTVRLRERGGTEVDTLRYTRALSGRDGVSMNRSPDGDPTGQWILHTDLVPENRSPGRRAGGGPF